MTKSWWSGEPGEQLLDALNPKDDHEPEHSRRMPVTWWTIAIAAVIVLAIIGAGVYLLTNAADTCKHAVASACEPTR